VYPLFSGIAYSFTDRKLLTPGSFVGLKNYIDVFQNADFLSAIKFTLVFSIIGLVGSLVLGLLMALLLNADIPCRSFFRSALLIPWIVPAVVSVTCWRWMVLTDTSLVNVILSWFGIDPIYFLSNAKWAVILVCVLKIWKNFPFVAVTILAAMQGISKSLYEAASIDGASKLQRFRRITLPSIMPVITTCTVLLCIWCFNDFENVYLLTQGGPMGATTNIVIIAYNYAFTKNDIGMSAAMAIIQLIVILIFATISLRHQQRRES
jgi:multiple sugar transport system permease protein